MDIVNCRIGSLETWLHHDSYCRQVNCRIGSLEINAITPGILSRVNCRIGSLENYYGEQRGPYRVNCRIGSLEITAVRAIFLVKYFNAMECGCVNCSGSYPLPAEVIANPCKWDRFYITPRRYISPFRHCIKAVMYDFCPFFFTVTRPLRVHRRSERYSWRLCRSNPHRWSRRIAWSWRHRRRRFCNPVFLHAAG